MLYILHLKPHTECFIGPLFKGHRLGLGWVKQGLESNDTSEGPVRVAEGSDHVSILTPTKSAWG